MTEAPSNKVVMTSSFFPNCASCKVKIQVDILISKTQISHVNYNFISRHGTNERITLHTMSTRTATSLVRLWLWGRSDPAAGALGARTRHAHARALLHMSNTVLTPRSRERAWEC